MGCCRNDGSFCPCNWDCPKAPIDLRPRALRWDQRFADVPAELASPYRGQIFDAHEATALEFIAFLVDRSLISEWPEIQQEAISATAFDQWFRTTKAPRAQGDQNAEPETTPASA